MINKKISVWEVVIIILTGCLAIRWIAVAGSIGHPAIIFWIIGALFFFIPLSIMIIDLSHSYKKQSSMYFWVKEALGEKYAFFTAWFYWITNLFFYPGLLVFLVSNLGYIIGDKFLSNSHFFVITISLIFLWISIFVNILGIKFMSKIASLSCILNIGLGVFLIIIGLVYLIFFHTNNTPFYWGSFLPNSNVYMNLSNLSLLIFALSGIELISIIYNSINNPKKTVYRSIVISFFIIITIYILGSLSINIILTPIELNNTTGLSEALKSLSIKINMPWILIILIGSLLVVEFGALLVWLITPTIMFFSSVEKGILPELLKKSNKNNVPSNALLLIGIFVTLIMIFTELLPTINSIFTNLLLVGTIFYLLVYLFLSISYIKLKYQGKVSASIFSKTFSYTIAIIFLICIILGMVLSFIPNVDIKAKKDIIIYELLLFLGPLTFIFIGYLIRFFSFRIVGKNHFK